jgi:hypothetical protein
LGLDFRKQNQTKFRFIAKRTATKISWGTRKTQDKMDSFLLGMLKNAHEWSSSSVDEMQSCDMWSMFWFD